MMNIKHSLMVASLGLGLAVMVGGCGTTAVHVPNSNPSHKVTAQKTPKVKPTPISSPTSTPNPSNSQLVNPPETLPNIPTVPGNTDANLAIKGAFTQSPIAANGQGTVTFVSLVNIPGGERITLSGLFYETKAQVCSAPTLPSVNGQPSQQGPAPKTATTPIYRTMILTVSTAIIGMAVHPSRTFINPTGGTVFYNCS